MIDRFPHLPVLRSLLRWIDSNELPWTFPLPPWAPPRSRALRRLRTLARKRLRAELIASQGWARTATQSLAWPLIAVIKAVRSLRDYPAPPETSLDHEVLTRWWLQVAHNLRISDQHTLFLHLPGHRARSTAFITCRENQALIGISRDRLQGVPRLSDKAAFDAFCIQNKLPTPSVIMKGNGIGVTHANAIPRADLFLKPAGGMKGRGAEILRHVPADDLWITTDGVRIDEKQLGAYAGARMPDEPWLIQERLRNAVAWRGFTSGALATVRVVTVRRQPDGEPECLLGLFRLPQKDAVVDNLSAGGLGTHVDLDTGRLGPARNWVDVYQQHDQHPDTGAQITGSILPGWEDIKSLAMRTHRAAGNWFSLGFDITLTDAGPIVVETNFHWAITPFLPIEETAYIERMNALFFPANHVSYHPHIPA